MLSNKNQNNRYCYTKSYESILKGKNDLKIQKLNNLISINNYCIEYYSLDSFYQAKEVIDILDKNKLEIEKIKNNPRLIQDEITLQIKEIQESAKRIKDSFFEEYLDNLYKVVNLKAVIQKIEFVKNFWKDRSQCSLVELINSINSTLESIILNGQKEDQTHIMNQNSVYKIQFLLGSNLITKDYLKNALSKLQARCNDEHLSEDIEILKLENFINICKLAITYYTLDNNYKNQDLELILSLKDIEITEVKKSLKSSIDLIQKNYSYNIYIAIAQKQMHDDGLLKILNIEKSKEEIKDAFLKQYLDNFNKIQILENTILQSNFKIEEKKLQTNDMEDAFNFFYQLTDSNTDESSLSSLECIGEYGTKLSLGSTDDDISDLLLMI
jgi:hypothetical protein